MILNDLIPPINHLTDAELHERVRALRRQKFEVRPALAKIKEKPARQQSKQKQLSFETKISNLTDDQKLALLKELTGE
jgi:hypothetical protein